MAEQRTPGALQAGRLARISNGIQPMWVLVVAFITYALGHDDLPAADPSLTPAEGYVLGLVSAAGGEALGIVSITDLQRRIRADEIASPAPRLAA